MNHFPYVKPPYYQKEFIRWVPSLNEVLSKGFKVSQVQASFSLVLLAS